MHVLVDNVILGVGVAAVMPKPVFSHVDHPWWEVFLTLSYLFTCGLKGNRLLALRPLIPRVRGVRPSTCGLQGDR